MNIISEYTVCKLFKNFRLLDEATIYNNHIIMMDQQEDEVNFIYDDMTTKEVYSTMSYTIVPELDELKYAIETILEIF